MNLLDLPVDILLVIFPYLDAHSFLALTSSCTALHSPDFVHDAAYWSTLIRNDFRVPNQPVVQKDGQRWQRLYRRLKTQSKVYTWGNNEKGCLGHPAYDAADIRAHGAVQARRVVWRQRHVSWPGEVQGLENLGVISDMQCGGWSTTLLTAKGALYSIGVIDGLTVGPRNPATRVAGMQQMRASPTALQYPPGLPDPKDRYDPATAVSQFSAGRAHILALSDSGRIWTWQDMGSPGLHVKFLHHETRESGDAGRKTNVKKVVAGWNKSAALVEGTGIVVWEPLTITDDETDVSDTALVLATAVVPMTSYTNQRVRHTSSSEGPSNADLATTVGEVLNFIVLDKLILFNTSLGKVFVTRIEDGRTNLNMTQPIELPLLSPEDSNDFVATDVQGSFRAFAIFTRSGAVLTSDNDRVLSFMSSQATHLQTSRLFDRIPALQNKDVISVAFGDWHFHALHAAGYITSYGKEPQACGALGLGGHGNPEGRLRGVRYQGIGGDGNLVPHAYTAGRRVWFEPEKQSWIRFLTSGGVDPSEASERMRMAIGSPGVSAQGELSEWVEQQGRDWEQKFNVHSEDDDGLGAYFALSVSAAGWHSGALMLVNEELAQKVRSAVEVLVKPAVETKPPSEEPVEAGPSETTAPTHPESSTLAHTAQPTSLTNRAADWGRYFLGMAPYNVSAQDFDPVHGLRPQPAEPTSPAHLPANMRRLRPFGPGDHPRAAQNLDSQPQNFGASPREGVDFVWAQDHFPRLRLSDGTEMPGLVEFDEWRYGRPDFQLDWEGNGGN